MRFLIVFLLWPLSLSAQSVADAIAEAPDLVLEEMSKLLLSYGDGALTQDGVDTALLHARAQARMRALSDVLSADLDADGAVSEAEFLAIADALSPWEKGRLAARLLRGDADRDGTLSAAEVAEFVDARVDQRLSSSKLILWAGAMSFDRDGDGTVTLREVHAVIEAAQAAEKAT
ncbi:MAG: hypothetical protein ACU0CI_12170 [Shimia sp.]